MILPLLLAGLLVLSACFSGSEAALFTLASRRGARLPAIARRLLADPEGTLTAILLGNLVVNLSYFATSATWGRALGTSGAVAVGAGAILALVVLGEILPKVLSHRHPVAAARVLSVPAFCVHLAIGPVARRMARRRAPEPQRRRPLVSDQLDSLLAEFEEEETSFLASDESGMLRDILELGILRAGAVRQPLAEVRKIDASLPLEEARKRLREERLSWAAVCDENRRIVGCLDLSRMPRGETVGAAMRPVPILPELAPAARGLTLMRDFGAPFVLLVDEYGDAAGVVRRGMWAETLIDRVPERREGAPAPIERMSRERWRIAAALPLHVFREHFGDPGEVDPRTDSIGGLVADRLGRVAEAGDRIEVSCGGERFEISVESCRGARPDVLRVTRLAEGAP